MNFTHFSFPQFWAIQILSCCCFAGGPSLSFVLYISTSFSNLLREKRKSWFTRKESLKWAFLLLIFLSFHLAEKPSCLKGVCLFVCLFACCRSLSCKEEYQREWTGGFTSRTPWLPAKRWGWNLWFVQSHVVWFCNLLLIMTPSEPIDGPSGSLIPIWTSFCHNRNFLLLIICRFELESALLQPCQDRKFKSRSWASGYDPHQGPYLSSLSFINLTLHILSCLSWLITWFFFCVRLKSCQQSFKCG